MWVDLTKNVILKIKQVSVPEKLVHKFFGDTVDTIMSAVAWLG